ncbi:hypothetical protein M752DRAFT_75858 [Aspergillus phoenicis ATCC 13157]|uniref:Uncharacterized protein n=1 Tax=Aspergillus phoenicis ATCC 13157 TaxID=1353007 RepID=A0A370P8J6_ASPPH|nr:hypothetical protein M752DRAFT_75858 [Aspergillus phoenicis ATCC 13157]
MTGQHKPCPRRAAFEKTSLAALVRPPVWDLGILSILAARYATIRSVVTPVVLVFATRTRPPAAPTPTPVPFHSSAHPPVTPVNGPRCRCMAMWRDRSVDLPARSACEPA